MSRIYDALRRASEEARQRKGQPAPPLEDKDLEGPEPSTPPVRSDSPSPSRPAPTLFDRDLDQPEPVPAPGSPPPAEPAGEAEPEATDTADGMSAYRTQLRQRLRVRLAQERDRHAAEGRHPFEGQWLTVKQIQRFRWRLRWRDLAILLQLLLLLLFVASVGLFLFTVLTQFLLPRAA